jgi:predicted amidohydrolase
MARSFRLAVSSILIQEIEKNCLAAISDAARRGADLVLLPEEPDIVSGKAPGLYPLESHPIFQAFSRAAAEARIGLISSLSAKVEGGYANSGFFLDRKGEILGLYRKQHPAPSEEAIVTTPAGKDPFPVFDYEGVKIAIAICMDVHFPEMFRIYSLKGADVVCLPTMYLDYTGDMLESIEKARAVDNQMYFALSRYFDKPFLAGKNMGYAKVIAPDGRVIVSTGHQEGVAVADFDPTWKMPFWGEGYTEFREMFNAIRKPELYGELVAPKTTNPQKRNK